MAKKATKAPAHVPEAKVNQRPVKSNDLVISRSSAMVKRSLEPSDYINIQAQMLGTYREKEEALSELNAAAAKVKDLRRKCADLEKANNKDLSVLASGVIEENQACLRVYDYASLTISHIDEDSGVAHDSREMTPWERQRRLNFAVTPKDDCHGCKYFSCQALEGACGNFEECFECRDFKCLNENGCGFSKDASGWVDPEVKKEFCKKDCFFCNDDHLEQPECQGCSLTGNCFKCGHFSCADTFFDDDGTCWAGNTNIKTMPLED